MMLQTTTRGWRIKVWGARLEHEHLDSNAHRYTSVHILVIKSCVVISFCSQRWDWPVRFTVLLTRGALSLRNVCCAQCDAVSEVTVHYLKEITLFSVKPTVRVWPTRSCLSSGSSHFLWLGVIAVEADADLQFRGSGLDCALPSRDSSSPEKPGPPSCEPVCAWWRTQRFPPAETKLQAPVWNDRKMQDID